MINCRVMKPPRTCSTRNAVNAVSAYQLKSVLKNIENIGNLPISERRPLTGT